MQTLFRNYKNKINEAEEKAKRNRNKIILGDELPTGVVKMAKVYIAKKKKLSVGDKMAEGTATKELLQKLYPFRICHFCRRNTG